MCFPDGTHTHKNENGLSVHVFWPRQASFGQLSLISDPHINLQNSQNGLNDHKGLENTNYTIVKYGEMLYGRYTPLTPAVVKILIDAGRPHFRIKRFVIFKMTSGPHKGAFEINIVLRIYL